MPDRRRGYDSGGCDSGGCDSGRFDSGRCDSGGWSRSGRRSQSEVIGFLLIFGVVIFTIILFGNTGFSGLDSARDYQRTTNAEQAFVVLADNVDDVTKRGAPSRETEIRLADASLSLDETERFTITVGQDSPENTTIIETEMIRYESGSGTSIVYSSGALIREDEGNAVMFREPDLVLSADIVLLAIVNTSLPSDGRVGGTTAVGVETRGLGTEIVARHNRSETRVSIEITSARSDAWFAYLDGETGGGCARIDSVTIECTMVTDRVLFTRNDVRVRFK